MIAFLYMQPHSGRAVIKRLKQYARREMVITLIRVLAGEGKDVDGSGRYLGKVRRAWQMIGCIGRNRN